MKTDTKAAYDYAKEDLLETMLSLEKMDNFMDILGFTKQDVKSLTDKVEHVLQSSNSRSDMIKLVLKATDSLAEFAFILEVTIRVHASAARSGMLRDR